MNFSEITALQYGKKNAEWAFFFLKMMKSCTRELARMQ